MILKQHKAYGFYFKLAETGMHLNECRAATATGPQCELYRSCHCVHKDGTWSELLITVLFSVVLFLVADFKGCLQCLQKDHAIILNWNMLCIKKESK